MAVSKSPLEFLRRKNLSEESLNPAPRLDARAHKIHTHPLVSPPKPSETVLDGFDGDPAPDRALTRPWPGLEEAH
jgi:hypothetical protein